MPSLQNRNNRRKGEEHSETLIIPHITKEMLEKARSMAAQGASRAEIEQAIAEMQGTIAPKPEESQPQPEPDARRIIPTSRKRHTDEERKAMLEQMRQEQAQREAERREEASHRTQRPAWHFPTSRPAPEKQPAARPAETAESRTEATIRIPAVKPAPQPARPAEPAQKVPEPAPAPQQQQPSQQQQQPVQKEPAPRREAPPVAPKRQAGLLRSRAEAEAELNEKIRSDHIWLSNPVMVRGLGLAPVIGAALDGERALILCVASLLLITFTRVLAVAVCHLSGNRFRPVIYSYAAALLYIPVYILLYEFFGNSLTALGIYLPILVVEPAIVKRMEFSELEPLGDALRHGFNNGIGMCIALLIVGCLREFLASGTVFGHEVIQTAPLPLAAQPAGGFVLVGVIAAVWCAVANAYTDYKREEVHRLYAGRKH